MAHKNNKKIKLITAEGFYKIIPADSIISRKGEKFTKSIEMRLYTPIQVRSVLGFPRTGLSYTIEFGFERMYRGYAEYRQRNFISNEEPRIQNL